MVNQDPNSDFWTQLIDGIKQDPEKGLDFDPADVEFGSSQPSVFDEVLGRVASNPRHTAVRALVDANLGASALDLPVEAGSRVAFNASLESVLTYPDVPHPACEGTVITVKTAEGPMTHRGADVFVMWDDGRFRSIRAEHLKPGSPRKTATNFRMVVSDLGDISSMFSARPGEDELVHKATKDLWSVRKDGSSFVIERLFDDTGKPLKV